MREETFNKKLGILKKTAEEYLSELRRKMINNFPFSGSLSYTMDLVPVRDNRVPTACTDGRSIYFDIEFLNSLTRDEALGVLAHEVWHNVMLHFMRTENRNRFLFNIATDLEVNQILLQEGMTLPKSCVLPANQNVPPNLSAEEYYDILDKRNDNSSSKFSGSGNSSSNGEASRESSSAPNADKHIYSDYDAASDKGDESREDKLGKVGHDSDFKPSIDERAAEQIRENAVEAAQQYERTRGDLPEYLKKLVNKLLTPEMDWKTVLQQFVTKTTGGNVSWTRPNRRFAHSGVYLPSHEDESIKIAVGIDTSASTASDIPRFLGELNGLVKAFPHYTLTIIQCDTEVKKVTEYTEDNPLDLENEKFEIEGMGGTRLKPIFDYIELNDVENDSIVILTDGEIEKFTPDMAPSSPTLWMITHGGFKGQIGFGEVYELESSN